MAKIPNSYQTHYESDNHMSSTLPPYRERETEPSLGELFSELTGEVTTLVRQEVQLARTELSQKASRAGRNIGFLAAGGLVAYAGFIILLIAALAALSLFMAVWLAALIVGVVVFAVGALLVKRGIENLREINPAPKKTMESLKQDKEWIKEQVQ